MKHPNDTVQFQSQSSVTVTGSANQPAVVSSPPLLPQPPVSSSPGFLEPLAIAAFVAVVVTVTRR